MEFKADCFYAGAIIVVSSMLISEHSIAAVIADPCAGPSAMLSLVDRPTKSDSACALPSEQIMLEAGYQYLNLNGGVIGQDYPQAELRIGLPLNNEFVILPPNYNTQTTTPHSGYDASVVGLKHEIGYNAHWLGAVEALLTLPTGGGGFGSDKYDPAINGVIEYEFNSALSLTLMLGISSQSLPASVNDQRFTSVNPDLVLSWQMTEKFLSYVEVYGQTRTGPGLGAGYDMDAGLLYLLTHHLEIDAEVGHHVSGNLGSFNNYYGVGMAIMSG